MDHVIVGLKEETSLSTRELYERLQEVNPGWTSTYAPGSILSWLRAFEVIEQGEAGRLQLTPRGREWAAMIHWTPESLEGAIVPGEVLANRPIELDDEDEVRPVLPSLKDVLERIPGDFAFSKEQVATLHAGLWGHPHRHFAILSGLSGSGKTSLAVEYAKALIALTGGRGSVSDRLQMIPVAPGWTDHSSLLGYVNPLREGEYVPTPFVELLASCAEHPAVIHFAVLDEMNLSHPEQYLAPLLSGMERPDLPVIIHGHDTELNGVPPSLPRYPSNLVIIGTVNMDETTVGLSDKVLDRAVILEFWSVDLALYPKWGVRELEADVEARARKVMEELMATLAPVRMHFGWRVVDDILDFLGRVEEDGVLTTDQALDWIVHAKVLPKLRGHDSRLFREALAGCRDVLERNQLPRSHSKVSELYRDLDTTGSARFWR